MKALKINGLVMLALATALSIVMLLLHIALGLCQLAHGIC